MTVKKNIVSVISLTLKIKENPNAHLIPLKQSGINVNSFITTFNEIAKEFNSNLYVKFRIQIIGRTFKIISYKPVFKSLILDKVVFKDSSNTKFAEKPGKKNINSIKLEDIKEVAKTTIKYSYSLNLDNEIKTLISTCKSMGLIIV